MFGLFFDFILIQIKLIDWIKEEKLDRFECQMSIFHAENDENNSYLFQNFIKFSMVCVIFGIDRSIHPLLFHRFSTLIVIPFLQNVFCCFQKKIKTHLLTPD